ncbi:MAG: hypothetical protein CMN97_09250 [Synechococcus sp. NAT40]|nr:hypothetical protein [Synechococcus sp. NAT40]RZO11836.1 MAG: hypothetical protein EVB08_08885 [Synechococcus sp. MED-G135]|tara:strand:- start:586 stop:969 length:384 start_codon:yes stop_codon:yes gene_type:complete
MPRFSIAALLMVVSAVGMPVALAQPRGVLPLSAGQPILEADAVLLASGWRPHPQQQPMALDQRRAGVPLSSLSACSGTGHGFCRFDYRRNGRQLSVVTIPISQRSRQTSQLGGVVKRWWVETVQSRR